MITSLLRTRHGRRGGLARTGALALLLTTSGCAGGDAQFNVRFAREDVPPHPTVSVFGVFNDGRMSPGAWEKLAPTLNASLGGGPCEVLFGDRLAETEPGFSADIDRVTREEGMSPELLQRIAPRSNANFVLLIDMYGKLPARVKDRHQGRGQAAMGAPGAMSGSGMAGGAMPGGMSGAGMRGGGMHGGGMHGGRMRGMGQGGQSEPRMDDNAFELTVTLISAETLKPVGRIAMHYTGASVDDALAKFQQRLSAELQGVTCAGWKWSSAPPP